MKLLYILNVANRVNNFSHTSMIAAKELGYEFHIAGNWGYKSHNELAADEQKYGIHIHQIDFERNPLSLKNYKAYKQLNKLFDKWDFDAVHCNTPIGGLLGRIVAKKNKVTPVLYQAHGFHFYKGAPILNWLIYYPIERILARLTDSIITINKEDYEFAKQFKLRNGGKVYYVPGVGIDTEKYLKITVDKNEKRKELGVPQNAELLLSVGDINVNKNHELIIKAMAALKNPDLHYCIAGKGNRQEYLEKLAEENELSANVHFLGYRKDVGELLAVSDVFCLPSLREGLPVSLMEAMATGLPCVASRVRGNTDLLDEGDGGFLCDCNDVNGFAEKISLLANDAELRQKMAQNNLDNVAQYDVKSISEKMKNIYTEVLK